MKVGQGPDMWLSGKLPETPWEAVTRIAPVMSRSLKDRERRLEKDQDWRGP
jgi:hypothetical protein